MGPWTLMQWSLEHMKSGVESASKSLEKAYQWLSVWSVPACTAWVPWGASWWRDQHWEEHLANNRLEVLCKVTNHERKNPFFLSLLFIRLLCLSIPSGAWGENSVANSRKAFRWILSSADNNNSESIRSTKIIQRRILFFCACFFFFFFFLFFFQGKHVPRTATKVECEKTPRNTAARNRANTRLTEDEEDIWSWETNALRMWTLRGRKGRHSHTHIHK